MFILSEEQQMAIGAGAGAVILATAGMAVKSSKKAKKALKKVSLMQKEINDLAAKIAEVNQNKINEQKLNKLNMEVEIMKSNNHDKIVKEVLKEIKKETK